MAISQGTKDLLAGGVWGSSDTAQKDLPEDLGIDRAVGYNQAYEQIGSGKKPERTGANQRYFEISSGVFDVLGMGVLSWDGEVNYTPSAGHRAWVATVSGLWSAGQNTGPQYGNATDPEQSGQTVWSRF